MGRLAMAVSARCYLVLEAHVNSRQGSSSRQLPLSSSVSFLGSSCLQAHAKPRVGSVVKMAGSTSVRSTSWLTDFFATILPRVI
jgi:hypothetical protein